MGWISFQLQKKLGWNEVGSSTIVIKWMGVQAEFILVSKTDLGTFLFIIFILSKTDSWGHKRFGRWWLCCTKANLSGNVQRSRREDFWVGYTWTRNQLGNLVSKWSWKVRTKRSFVTAWYDIFVTRYQSKGVSKKALGLGIGAGFLGGAALGVGGAMATNSVYQR